MAGVRGREVEITPSQEWPHPGWHLLWVQPPVTATTLRHGAEAGRCGGVNMGRRETQGWDILSTLWGKLFSQEVMFSQTALYKEWREEGLPYMLACDDDDTMWAWRWGVAAEGEGVMVAMGALGEPVGSCGGAGQRSVSWVTRGELQRNNGFRPFSWTYELLNEKIKALSKSIFFCFFTKLHRYPTYASRETDIAAWGESHCASVLAAPRWCAVILSFYFGFNHSYL